MRHHHRSSRSLLESRHNGVCRTSMGASTAAGRSPHLALGLNHHIHPVLPAVQVERAPHVIRVRVRLAPRLRVRSGGMAGSVGSVRHAGRVTYPCSGTCTNAACGGQECACCSRLGEPVGCCRSNCCHRQLSQPWDRSIMQYDTLKAPHLRLAPVAHRAHALRPGADGRLKRLPLAQAAGAELRGSRVSEWRVVRRAVRSGAAKQRTAAGWQSHAVAGWPSSYTAAWCGKLQEAVPPALTLWWWKSKTSGSEAVAGRVRRNSRSWRLKEPGRSSFSTAPEEGAQEGCDGGVQEKRRAMGECRGRACSAGKLDG